MSPPPVDVAAYVTLNVTLDLSFATTTFENVTVPQIEPSKKWFTRYEAPGFKLTSAKLFSKLGVP
jgi:hypothetical protein